MEYISGKGIYRQLGNNIDQLPARAPWNASLHAILKELYTPEEAEIIVRMPYGFSTLARIARISKLSKPSIDSPSGSARAVMKSCTPAFRNVRPLSKPVPISGLPPIT